MPTPNTQRTGDEGRKKIHKSYYRPHDIAQCQICDWEFDGHHNTNAVTLKAINEHVFSTGHNVHRERGEAIHYNLY